jgi:hypothetical protein
MHITMHALPFQLECSSASGLSAYHMNIIAPPRTFLDPNGFPSPSVMEPTIESKPQLKQNGSFESLEMTLACTPSSCAFFRPHSTNSRPKPRFLKAGCTARRCRYQLLARGPSKWWAKYGSASCRILAAAGSRARLCVDLSGGKALGPGIVNQIYALDARTCL